jgi:hypothetical protein
MDELTWEQVYRLASIDRFIADCQVRGKAAILRASQIMREV